MGSNYSFRKIKDVSVLKALMKIAGILIKELHWLRVSLLSFLMFYPVLSVLPINFCCLVQIFACLVVVSQK